MMKQAQGDREGTDFEAGAVQTTTNLVRIIRRLS